MMMSEFTQRTGVYPTPWEYEKIEEQYYAFDGTKDAFCADWVAKDGPTKLYAARAKYIEELESELSELGKAHHTTVKRMADRIAELTAELDKELEWKDSDSAGTRFEQSRYEELSSAGRVLTDALAKSKVAECFGFAPEMVDIIYSVKAYQMDKHHRLREKETFERPPVYNATDWNYIRFNVRGWQYEMVNGQLRPYCS